MRVDRTRGKGNLVLGNRDCQSSIEDKVEKQTEKTGHTFLDKMEAIAFGVQLRFEENSGFSRGVTGTTVDAARELGIPEDEIKRWVSSRLARLIRDTEKLKEIKSRLERLQGNSQDQADNKRHS